MKTITYLLQVSACTGIFYGFYFLLLRRLTFFTLNRWYLLATLLLSFIIPAINISIDTVRPPTIIQPVMYLNQIQVIDEPVKDMPEVTTQPVVEKAYDWVTPVKVVYMMMMAISVLHLAFTLLVFYCRSRAGRLMQIGNVKVLRGNGKQGNSSFLNVIFVNDDGLEPDEIKQIIAHEMLHVQLLHSADRIIARLVQIVLWFNPFTYCYIRSIEENHEFEVDRIIACNANKSIYAQLLFKLSISGQSYLMHSFSKVPLKSRIAMLFNKPTSNMKKIIYALVLPVVAISCLAFSNLETKSLGKAPSLKVLLKAPIEDTTIRYRQKVKQTPAQKIANDKSKAEYEAYRQTDEFKQKMADAERATGKTLTYKVISYQSLDFAKYVKEGFVVANNNSEFIISTGYGQSKQLKEILKPGNEIEMKVLGAALWGKGTPVLIEPAVISRDGIEIYRAAEAAPLPKTAFLYEANRVRYTDGQVTNIKKYPNGKWKSALIEVVNGYKIKFNIKPNAPDFKNLEWGDHVRFRFVHEFKTGAKEYTVNDWVSLSNDIKDYGTKNPDFFFKFYEKM
ncbi:M56 family metallopeptidase [Mucilaginibacter lutimaris]|uniref:M56 family metallopeptidase n=1 Tax=Mucilaginibacter lutimaris TaxID=931629 RepID=A0ABW2ZFM0_9SPHI